MPLVILQPCANKDAREHYNDTIQNPVDLDSIKSFLSPNEYTDLLEIYPDKKRIPHEENF